MLINKIKSNNGLRVGRAINKGERSTLKNEIPAQYIYTNLFFINIININWYSIFSVFL